MNPDQDRGPGDHRLVDFQVAAVAAEVEDATRRGPLLVEVRPAGLAVAGVAVGGTPFDGGIHRPSPGRGKGEQAAAVNGWPESLKTARSRADNGHR